MPSEHSTYFDVIYAIIFNIFRWKGERLLRTVLEAGREAMGTAGAPYRIGTVKQVYGVVSI